MISKLVIALILIQCKANCLQYWRRLAPLAQDLVLGNVCKSSLQCLLFVPHSQCDWTKRKCECQPYHVPYNNTMCLPASLLSYACKIDAQCTLKVPNSQCSNGKCVCKNNFISFRKDKCLPRASLNDYCLNNEMCSSLDNYTQCKWIVPRIYGKCTCLTGHFYSTKNKKCWPKLGNACNQLDDCKQSVEFSECVYLLDSISKDVLSNYLYSNFLNQNTLNAMNSFKKTSLQIINNSLNQETSLKQKKICKCENGYEPDDKNLKCIKQPKIDSELDFEKENAEMQFTNNHNFHTNYTNNIIQLSATSLGRKCKTSIECQLRDPYSKCIQGICECIMKDATCSSKNKGCHENTFQCKNGECISWYFVCDKNTNCEDGSDESECTKFNCPKEAFQCDDGTCLSKGIVCNGKSDCPDGSDEKNCKINKTCDKSSFTCQNGQCLPQYTFCNTVTDCKDESDERSFICEQATTCPPNTFQCKNRKCRSTAILCSGVDGCGDNSDEDKCSVCFCKKPKI